jgi:AcrR family transcriptional regulator
MLVDVARQLFAREGKDNVTMNDIANASKRGRRTLYTYFQNKNAIYKAVIEREISLLNEKIEAVIRKDIAPDQKLLEYIFVHLDATSEALSRNGSLKADFFKDIYEVEHARRREDFWEMEQLEQIFQEGIDQDIFRIKDAHLAAVLMLASVKGLEQYYSRPRYCRLFNRHKRDIVNALFSGLCK